MDHPNVVKLYEVYENEDYLYLVMELLAGGELFDRIVAKKTFSEQEAADVIRPLVQALKYCHSLGVIHRDLKVPARPDHSRKTCSTPPRASVPS